MIEKKLVEVLAPLADRIIDLEKRVAQTPAPKDGKDGRDGADAPAVDIDTVVEKLIPHIPAPLKGEQGAPGASPAVADVAAAIKSDSVFVEALRGNGIKSLSTDGVKLTFGLDNGDEIEVELPVGPEGAEGVPGVKGERGEKGGDGLGIEVKAWAPGVYREGTFRASDLGKIYKAVRDTADAPGASEDWERVGSFGFAWTGLKKADYAYQDGDLYIDNGSAFLWFGGKGNMFCQKGPRGAQGDRGADGRDGKDAPTIVHLQWRDKALDLVLSDGTVFEAEVEGYEKAVESLVQSKLLNFLEAEAQQIENEGGTPLRSFRGQFLYNESYSVGDVVVFNKTLYVARKANRKDFILEDWRKVYTGGGGGGGGGSGGWNYIATQQINMNRLQIVNMAPPRAGNVGQLDAVNRIFLESAIAAGSLFQGTVTELTQTNLPRLPDPTTKGHYWTWVGAANHVIGPADTTLNADLNGQLLQVGDWIQSNGVSWSHVPGDLLSKQRWQTLGGFTDWVAGQSYEVGSLVHYQGHLYRAETALTGAAGETAPNVRSQPLVISFGTVTAGKHYTITVSGGISTGNSVLNINLDVDDTPGIDTQTAPIIAGQTAANVAAAIVGGWSNTSTTAVLRLNTSIIDVNVVKQTDTITSLGVNQTTLDAANTLGGNVQRWTDISPRMNLSDLADTAIFQPARSDHLIYDGTRWANKNPFVQMTKAAYTALGTNVDPDVLYLIKG